MVTVRVQVLGDTVISRRFLRVAANGQDFTDSWNTILDAFEDWTGEQFATQGDFFGTPWEPLKDDTIAEKERLGVPDPAMALVRGGALALSFQGGPGGVRDVSPDGADWGSRNEDAMWHHGRERSGTNPVSRRPIFEPDEAHRRWVMSVLQRDLFDGAR